MYVLFPAREAAVVQVLLVRASLKVERVLIFVHRSTCRPPPTAPVCLTLWRHPCDKRTRRGLILSGLGLSRSKGKDICWKDDSSFSNGSPFHVQISSTHILGICLEPTSDQSLIP